MLKEDKMERIKKYVLEEIGTLKTELGDKTLYKKNPYPHEETSVMQTINESEE